MNPREPTEGEKALHEDPRLPKGEWCVVQRPYGELFIATRKNGTWLARLWNGRSGRNAVASLFAASKDLLEAADAVYEAFRGVTNSDLSPDQVAALLALENAAKKSRKPID